VLQREEDAPEKIEALGESLRVVLACVNTLSALRHVDFRGLVEEEQLFEYRVEDARKLILALLQP